MEGDYVYEVDEMPVEEFVPFSSKPPGNNYRAVKALALVSRNARVFSPEERVQLRDQFKRSVTRVSCSSITHVPTTTDGLYKLQREEVPLDVISNNEALVARLSMIPDSTVYRKPDREIIDEIPLRTEPALYAYSFPIEGQFSGIFKSSAAMQTSRVAVGRCPPMSGINTEHGFLGGEGSCSEIHSEDSNLGSYSIIYCFGDEAIYAYPDFDKIPGKKWLIIIDDKKFTVLMQDKLSPLPDGVQDVAELAGSSGGLPCPFPLDHKDNFVTLKFLDDNNIRYQVFDQGVNDLVYIRPGVKHQAHTVVPCFAGAMNFADFTWLIIQRHTRHCDCPLCQLDYVPVEENYIARVVGRQLPIYVCDDCHWDTLSKKRLKAHLRSEHGYDIPTWTPRDWVYCNVCEVGVQNMHRHVQECARHAEILIQNPNLGDAVPDSDKVKCPFCSGLFMTHEINFHKTYECGSKLFACEICARRYMQRKHLNEHVKKSHPPEAPGTSQRH
ncbi:hypothetical protein QAD02_003865 [Eretmocerus hayati]|uniref:Uncharacterized protein n=1 Tax=Eretmocerus hayati TaxID=131215 RepID=A0ACC2NN88_9HYME|nr:hypothetical protein QAD02_003865 [Eretmocerus hayati]